MSERIALSTLLACLLVPLPARAQCPAPASPVMTVRGSASVEQKPDTAEFSISVTTRGPTLDGTTRGHKARVVQAEAALDRLRAQVATVEADGFSLTEERSATSPGARAPDPPPTYRAETRYTVTSKALDRIDGLAAEIVSTGLFEFGSVRFTVGDKGEPTDRARRAAMADARHQADVYAEAAGLRLDGVERITDGDAAGADGAYDVPAPVSRARSMTVGINPPKALAFQGNVTMTWRVAPR